MAITLKQVATRTKLCHQTVSDILNRRPGKWDLYAASTRKRVQEAAAEMGYMPNTAARATRSGRFGAITLLLSTGYARSTVPTDLLNTLLQQLSERDLNLMAVRLPDDQLTDDRYVPRILRETHSDGLLIDYTHAIPQRLIDLIDEHKIPAVWLNSKQPHCCVRPDDLDAAKRATRYLIELGHRHIAYADFSYGHLYPTPHYSALDREAGYRIMMDEAGLEPWVIRDEGVAVRTGTRCAFARQCLGAADRPSAVISYGSTTAEPFMIAALQQGLSVPADLSVVSFADTPSQIMDQVMTTYVVPHAQIGIRATEMLLESIEQPQETFPETRIPFSFEVGGTASPPAVT